MNTELSLSATEQTLNGIFIPPCPATLTELMREIKHPEASLEKIAQLISRDAGMLAPLLKLANSPFVGLRTKVTSVMHAANILGLRNIMNLVHNIALRQSLGGEGQSFDKFWERSTIAASGAEKMAAKFPTVSREESYIAALFHDCGIPVLMQKYPDYRATVMADGKQGIPLCETEDKHYSTNHAVVGNMLTRSWALPARVSMAILLHHDETIFTSPDNRAGADVRDLIGLIHMAENVTDEHLHVRDKDWDKHGELVLAHFELSEQEFSELKWDMLAFLNGE
ncbi:MAG: HDOD domain-containing protein [Gammaproteobacteria bacterium]|nr:HDOD domain-containing protein [Gammaproteobacteria bacterium]MBU4044806.1 HDOD domain-containing protein [Gammaproteobacteria bacterium]MBU4150353.1 HDOD domain-containing protein [Gammaproteobacteria bacterium]